MAELTLDRQRIAHRGKRLEYFTIGWNTLEGITAVVAGTFAGSISLVGYFDHPSNRWRLDWARNRSALRVLR